MSLFSSRLKYQAIEESEKAVSKLAHLRQHVSEIEHENHGLRTKIDQCQQQIIHNRKNTEDSAESPFMTADLAACDHTLLPQRRQGRLNWCHELEREEEQLKGRLRSFKESLRTCSAPTAAWNNLHTRAKEWQSGNPLTHTVAVVHDKNCVGRQRHVCLEKDEAWETDTDAVSDAMDSCITDLSTVPQQPPARGCRGSPRREKSSKENAQTEKIAKQTEQLVELFRDCCATDLTKSCHQQIVAPARAQQIPVEIVKQQGDALQLTSCPQSYSASVTCHALSVSSPDGMSFPTFALPSQPNPFLLATNVESSPACLNVDLPIDLNADWKTEQAAIPSTGIPFLPLPPKFAELFPSAQTQILKTEAMPMASATPFTCLPNLSPTPSKADHQSQSDSQDRQSEYTEDFEVDETNSPSPPLPSSLPQSQPPESNARQTTLEAADYTPDLEDDPIATLQEHDPSDSESITPDSHHSFEEKE